MKFGLSLFFQYGRHVSPAHELELRLERLRLARDCGFHTASVGDHFALERSPDGPGRLNGMLTLARVIPESGDMLLATSVLLLPLHHPVEVAEQAATLDVLSNGRFALGVGLGWRDLDFDAVGVPRHERVSRFVESIELIKRLWTEDMVTFQGKYFQLEGVSMTLKPIQHPRPPIWIGGSSMGAIRRAARLGDAWIVTAHLPIPLIQRQREVYLETLTELNKPVPPETIATRGIVIAEDHETAVRDAQRYLKGARNVFTDWGMYRELVSFGWKGEELTDATIVGGPEECIEQIAEHREKVGINHLILNTYWPGEDQTRALRAIELFGSKVLPYFREQETATEKSREVKG
ncbi:MAG: LLM class flavin-dependent oxidoreductase [Chloroflexi bacterium]|nr:LLM class flavin-dependent oxidoreductase [Chloroflexota bacterium]